MAHYFENFQKKFFLMHVFQINNKFDLNKKNKLKTPFLLPYPAATFLFLKAVFFCGVNS
jgi:hypothetical protein